MIDDIKKHLSQCHEGAYVCRDAFEKANRTIRQLSTSKVSLTSALQGKGTKLKEKLNTILKELKSSIEELKKRLKDLRQENDIWTRSGFKKSQEPTLDKFLENLFNIAKDENEDYLENNDKTDYFKTKVCELGEFPQDREEKVNHNTVKVCLGKIESKSHVVSLFTK